MINAKQKITYHTAIFMKRLLLFSILFSPCLLQSSPSFSQEQLSRETLAPPLNINNLSFPKRETLSSSEAHVINTNYTGILEYLEGSRRYLATIGLFDCAAVFFYDPRKKRGLLSHFYSVRYINYEKLYLTRILKNYVMQLLENFYTEEDMEFEFNIDLIWGGTQEAEKKVVKELEVILKDVKSTKFNSHILNNAQLVNLLLDLYDGKIEAFQAISLQYSNTPSPSKDPPNESLVVFRNITFDPNIAKEAKWVSISI